MEFNKKIATDFWANGTHKYECDFIDEISRNDIKESIRRAFRDLTVRTMTKKHNAAPISLDILAERTFEGENNLLIRFESLIKETQHTKENFDIWHKDTCDYVVDFLREYYDDKSCTIGKAQKIVNMSFKNLYAVCCSKNIEHKYYNQFQYCHVPLDSFILEWFYRNCSTKENKILKSYIPSWSAINTYGDENLLKDKKTYTYFYFQKVFRDNIKGCTPLQAEFIIWNEIKLTLVAEDFYFTYNENLSNAKKEEFKRKSINDKISEIKNCLIKQGS